MNQIQILQELRSKCLEVSGYYGDIDTAIAALQICSTYGMDMTARFISDLRKNGIKDNDDLRQTFNNAYKAKEVCIMKSNNEYKCPICNSKLEEYNTYCKHCGQHLIDSECDNGVITI